MAEPFKNMYNERFFENFTEDLKLVIKDFDSRGFVSRVMDDEWEKRELKQRCAHITSVLKEFMPRDFKKAVAKILELLDHIEKRHPEFSEKDDNKFGLTLEYGSVLDNYVEQYGLDDYETSVRAIERITQFTSCEFSVHHFIRKYPDRMMKQMAEWSVHPHWGVRRLASEGCRPRLPWAVALPDLKNDPSPIFPILENLKNDPSRFVRLSVANNLNDIAKDNPRTVVDIAKRWKGESEDVDRVIKHGCRTLLKQGDPEVMELFGLGTVTNIDIVDFRILTPEVRIGESLEFGFTLTNKNESKTAIRLGYAIYYRRANGTLFRKVHKISEKEYAGNSATPIVRRHSFKIVTTRKFHPGLHSVAVMVNGKEFGKEDFLLIV